MFSACFLLFAILDSVLSGQGMWWRFTLLCLEPKFYLDGRSTSTTVAFMSLLPLYSVPLFYRKYFASDIGSVWLSLPANLSVEWNCTCLFCFLSDCKRGRIWTREPLETIDALSWPGEDYPIPVANEVFKAWPNSLLELPNWGSRPAYLAATCYWGILTSWVTRSR